MNAERASASLLRGSLYRTGGGPALRRRILSSVMTLLRRVLYLEALLWSAKGAVLALFPRYLLVNIVGLEPYPEYAWVRVAGAMAFSLALLMVLVAQDAERSWFWTWAFVIPQASMAVLFLAKAAFTSPTSSWFWWASGAFSAAMTAALLWGIARAYGEVPQEAR